MERRFLSFASAPVRLEKRADNEPPKIVGYGAVFFDPNDPGSEYSFAGWSCDYREHIMPGCFDRAIREDDVRGLFNHDANCLLGRTAAGTMKLSVDKRGLLYEITPPDTQTGRDVQESIRRGDLSGSSFAFIPTDTSFREIKEDNRDVVIREINAVQLFDVGPVVYPAYESSTTGIRSKDDAKEAKRALKAWRKQREANDAVLAARLAGYRARAVEIQA